MRATSSGSRTSAVTAVASIPSHVSAAEPASRSAATTRAPAAANARTVARPMPEPAPVTSATLPSSVSGTDTTMPQAEWNNRPRDGGGASAGPAGVPARGAADAGALVRRAHPAGLLRDRVPRDGAVRRVALPPHGRRGLSDDRAALDAGDGRAVRRRRDHRHDPLVRDGPAVAAVHGHLRERVRARLRDRGLLVLHGGDLHRDLRLRLGS